MTRAIRLEFRKMRRLRQVLVLLAMVLAVAALSSVSLFSAGVRQDFGDPTARPWESHLMTYTMMAAMTSPILTAVLASRQTDIEHSANGWILAGTAGVTPGVLVRAKLAALSVLLTGGVAVQTALVAGMGFVLGIRVPFDPAPWLGYAALLCLVNVALLALHAVLAAVSENQLVGVGIGMLGAFAAVFSLLIPPVITRFIPWGYYAMISQVTYVDRVIVRITPPYAWIAGFVLLVAALFVLATRRFDRIAG